MKWPGSNRTRTSRLPRNEVIKSWRRLYPQDGYAAHAIGYVGEISESELESPQFIDYHQGDIIGKDGMEKEYDSTSGALTDNNAYSWIAWVMSGRWTNPGRHARERLTMTLDLDLQAVAELAMDDKHGAVVALDPRSGGVLAMVSRPTFDPNKFTGRISRADWQAISGDPYKPLMNRVTQAELAPGSTFKPIWRLPDSKRRHRRQN